MSEQQYCHRSYGLNDRTCYKEKGHKGAHGSASQQKVNPIYADAEAMLWFQFFQPQRTFVPIQHYFYGIVKS